MLVYMILYREGLRPLPTFPSQKRVVAVSMPPNGSNISEARGMKKVNGRWIMKDEHK